MIGLILRRGRREDEKKDVQRGEPLTVGVDYKRVVIDGEELLVRRIIRITDDEVVYEDPYGNVKVFKRRKKKLLGLF